MTAIQTPVEHSPQDAGAPAISKEAAKAVIAARLRALGHPPDLLDHQAVTALVEHAGGSGVRLRAALASALFLASTEDASRIGRALVNRALQESGDIPPAPQASVSRPAHRWLLPGAAAVAGAVFVLALLVYHPWSPPVANLPARPVEKTIAQASTGPAQNAPAGRANQFPNRAVPKPPPEPPGDLAKPLPNPAPASVVIAPPVPAAAEPAAAPPEAPAETAASAVPLDLPAVPPANVVLMVSTRDAAAAQRLDGLVRDLRAAGIDHVVTQPSSSARARRAVSYFFADDLPLAQRITQILAGEGWPRLASNSLAPRLVIPPPGMPQRQPGLIEIQLP